MSDKVKQKKEIDLRDGDLIVDVDWSSTGLWLHRGNVVNVSYAKYKLPPWLVERFRYWTGWYNSKIPEKFDYSDMDLFNAYGRALAIDLKRIVGEKQRVFYGFHADNVRHCQVSTEEILVPDEQLVQQCVPRD